ncbi:hypothetical protein [Nocardia pseudobrasiliensis]|uniref:Uncharacterized protein n=1 Tax=Nocardia pseudobrasiliensis TaxID=45979 RepID=A0A370I9P4_9NOCA|nr:hypothetical protein [Nocardia pseudobrasiliensis]RDI67456.1 hypothetical protein DFR76_103527 [Nocardia pseudobrasiliensis]
MLTTIPVGWEGRTDLGPTLEVMTDGRAVKSPDAASAERKPGTAPQKLTGRIAPEVLAAAMVEAKALAAMDMGMPSDGDSSSTLLDFLGATPDQDVHLVVYSPNASGGLSDEQKGARQRFNELCKRLLDGFAQDR